MKWTKKDELDTVEKVVVRNSGMSLDDLKRTDWDAIISNLQETADYLRRCAKERKKVAVFADYDCDGICSAVIMHIILKSLAIYFKIYFPKRKIGYGLQRRYIEEMEEGFDVIVTIDNGIAAFDGIKAAKEKGMEVVVIDHHLRSQEGILNKNSFLEKRSRPPFSVKNMLKLSF